MRGRPEGHTIAEKHVFLMVSLVAFLAENGIHRVWPVIKVRLRITTTLRKTTTRRMPQGRFLARLSASGGPAA